MVHLVKKKPVLSEYH